MAGVAALNEVEGKGKDERRERRRKRGISDGMEERGMIIRPTAIGPTWIRHRFSIPLQRRQIHQHPTLTESTAIVTHQY